MDSLLSTQEIRERVSDQELEDEFRRWNCPFLLFSISDLLEINQHARMIGTLLATREVHYCYGVGCEAKWRCPTHSKPCSCRQDMIYNPQIVPEGEERVFYCSDACATPIEIHMCSWHECKKKAFACRSPRTICRCLSNVEHGTTAFCSSVCWNAYQTQLEQDQERKRRQRRGPKPHPIHKCPGCKKPFVCEQKKRACICLKALMYLPEDGEWADYNAAQKLIPFCSKECMSGPTQNKTKTKNKQQSRRSQQQKWKLK